MKKQVSKKIAAMALLWLAAGSHTVAVAVNQDQTLGSNAGVVDRYRIVCSALNGADTFRLATQVKNNTASSPLLSVQVYKGSQATNGTDTAGGDDVYSPLTYINRGNATYFIAVDKAGTGAVNYTLYYQCETSQGVATGTAISLRQDQ